MGDGSHRIKLSTFPFEEFQIILWPTLRETRINSNSHLKCQRQVHDRKVLPVSRLAGPRCRQTQCLRLASMSPVNSHLFYTKFKYCTKCLLKRLFKRYFEIRNNVGTWKVNEPPRGCSASAMTETLLHSTVNLSGSESTEMVEWFDLLGSSWKKSKMSLIISYIFTINGNFSTQEGKTVKLVTQYFCQKYKEAKIQYNFLMR